jgi:hypothetical protein
VPDQPTVSNLIDFLSDHEGDDVYVEIGTRDRESTEQPADAFLLKLHGYKLGKVEDATDHNPGGERKAAMVWLERRDSESASDDDEREGTRLFIDPRRVTEIQGDPNWAMKVWLDNAVYVSLSSR